MSEIRRPRLFVKFIIGLVLLLLIAMIGPSGLISIKYEK